MGLSYFWFVASAIIGAMDLYFGNILLLVISGAAFITAILSFFLPSVYFQVAIFAVISLLVMIFIAALNRYRRTVDNYSESLRRHVGRSVTVHEWRSNRFATVQYDGRLWEAEIAFNNEDSLRAGKYRIWKILPNRLVLIK